MLLKVLKHTELCKSRMCLIVPLWPTRDWWSFITSDGSSFETFIHGVRNLGVAHDLFLPGASGNEIPRGHANWFTLALLVDFLLPSATKIPVPDDPYDSRRLQA